MLKNGCSFHWQIWWFNFVSFERMNGKTRFRKNNEVKSRKLWSPVVAYVLECHGIRKKNNHRLLEWLQYFFFKPKYLGAHRYNSFWKIYFGRHHNASFLDCKCLLPLIMSHRHPRALWPGGTSNRTTRARRQIIYIRSMTESRKSIKITPTHTQTKRMASTNVLLLRYGKFFKKYLSKSKTFTKPQ